MASIILGIRQGVTKTATYTFAQAVEVDFVMTAAANFLRNKTAESTIAKTYGRLELAPALAEVFGIANNETVANRIAVHIWPETSVRQSIGTTASNASNLIGSIVNTMNNNDYKSVTVKVTYKEVYNLATGRTVLTVIESATHASYKR